MNGIELFRASLSVLAGVSASDEALVMWDFSWLIPVQLIRQNCDA